MSSERLNAIYILNEGLFEKVYGPEERRDIDARVHVQAPPFTAQTILDRPDILREADVILSSWGMPLLDEAFLNIAERLKAVFYGAGSVRGFVTDAFWRRDIVLCSAWGANAVPVSDYTVAAILFCLKDAFRMSRVYCETQSRLTNMTAPGAYGSTVGLISLGMIGRLVRERLRPFDLKVLAYDPYVAAAEAATLGVTLVPLDVLFRECDVVSLHTPWLKETEGMIDGAMFASMKHGASFVNTARGAVVRETEMIEVLRQRPDLFAVLDVTRPEPPAAGSPLYTLPNLFLTPHIAGAMNDECRRMGRYMVEELDRFLTGRPQAWRITESKAAILA